MLYIVPSGSDGKETTCNAGDLGSIPGSGRSPGEGNGNPLQYSCLENPMDRGAWRATVHGVAKSRTRLSDFHFRFNTVMYTMYQRRQWHPTRGFALVAHLILHQKDGAAAAAAKSLESCLTLCDPIDGSPPGSSIPGTLQARTLERVAISFSNA